MRHLHQIAQVGRRDSIQQDRIIAKVLVADHPVEGQHLLVVQPLDPRPSQLWLGLERQIGGPTAAVAAVLIGRGEPFLGHVQPPIGQGIAVLAGITGDDAGLTIRHLAKRPAPLAGHADRLGALFGEVATIDDQHAGVPIAHGVGDQLLVGLQHGSIVPGAEADKLLHGLDIAVGQRQCHRLNRFAVEIEQLAVQIGQRPLALFGAREERREVRVIRDQEAAMRCSLTRWRAVWGDPGLGSPAPSTDSFTTCCTRALRCLQGVGLQLRQIWSHSREKEHLFHACKG